MGAMTKLDAVNQMLLFAGEMIVSDLANNSGVDTTIAEFILDSKTLDYQQRGLAENQRIERVVTDSQGKIKIRTDAISVEMVDPPKSVSDGLLEGKPCRIVTRNGYLYNLTDDTIYFDKTKNYDLMYVLEISWEDMDTPIQKAIATQAAREYQLMSGGDPGTDRYLALLEDKYVAKAKGADTKDKGYNIIDHSTIDVQKMIRGRNMYYDPNRARFGK